MALNKLYRSQRLSRSQKNANDKEYYKEQIKQIDNNSSSVEYNGVSEYKRKKVNYDLYNNILNHSDFEYVCQPFGAEAGELPAKMVNRDIVSSRIKAIEGMEMKRAFPWKPIAVNRQATTRKEEEEFGRIKEFVIAEIMKPIQSKIQEKYAEEAEGRKINKQEKAQIQEKIKQELDAKTPDKVRRYMERKHQDPSEVLSEQILNYINQEQRVKEKFSSGWKHANLSAHEVYYVGLVNNKPVMKVTNCIRFEYDRSPDIQFIEDSRWQSCEYRMTPEEIVHQFGDELTDKQIDDLYEKYEYYAERGHIDAVFDFSKSDTETAENDNNFIRVKHAVWRGLRKIGFLSYLDKNDEVQEKYVDESYKINKEANDIEIEWEWLEEAQEGYMIGTDIFVGLQPVPGQFKDMNTLKVCKLSYYGVSYDDMNSQPTCPMDRMKQYQYYYNIVWFRLEMLLASDKGKKVLMNLDAIPSEAGIDIKKWQYFFESTPFMWYSNDEEGSKYQDANSIAKQIDMSLVSDISKYMEIAEYLEKKCGKSVGIPDEVIGDISPSAEVGNTRQQIASVSNILEPMFNLHTQVKRNVLQALLEAAKVGYTEEDPGILSYILDDLSHKQFTVDQNMLDASTVGIFITDATKVEESKELIKQLAHAAMQNDKAKLSDVISIIREDSIQEVEEMLRVAESKSESREQEQKEAERKNQKELQQMQQEENALEHKRKKDIISHEEALQYKREMAKQTILSMGFNENKDVDNDGVPDVLEVARDGVDADIRNKELQQRKDEFQHKKQVDKKELKIKEKQASKPKK